MTDSRTDDVRNIVYETRVIIMRHMSMCLYKTTGYAIICILNL